MDREKAFQTVIKMLAERRRHAAYNAKHMNIEWYREKLEDEAKEYAEAEKIMKDEMENKDE